MLTILEKIGIVCITIVGFQITRWLINFLYYNFIGPNLKFGINLAKVGKWAVVTGATDGVGKAYAEALAKKGLNIVLISRSEAKLEAVAADIEKEYKVQTKIIAADFTEAKIYEDIEKQLTGLDIGTLVNNVGMSYPHPDYFLELKDAETTISKIIICNIFSVTYMCKVVLPGMVERKKGIVINISSTSAQIPSPLLTVYAATKAYVRKFSEDLGAEYAKHGITVQCLLPGYVATKMSKIRSSTWMAPSPKRYVQCALKTVGVQESGTGYYPHTLLVGVVHTIYSISPKFAKWFIIRTMENIRNRAKRRNIY